MILFIAICLYVIIALSTISILIYIGSTAILMILQGKCIKGFALVILLIMITPVLMQFFTTSSSLFCVL